MNVKEIGENNLLELKPSACPRQVLRCTVWSLGKGSGGDGVTCRGALQFERRREELLW